MTDPQSAMSAVVEKLLPNFLYAIYCAARRHPKTLYTAVIDGKRVSVITCRCGRKQGANITPSNREMRRLKRRS